MTGNASLHPKFASEVDERTGKRRLHFPDVSMAGLTQDLAGHHMSAMREVHVFSYAGNPNPRYPLSGCQQFHEPCLLGGIANLILMTIKAFIPSGQARVVGCFRSHMTMCARYFFLGNMNLVLEGNGLVRIPLWTASRHSQRNADDEHRHITKIWHHLLHTPSQLTARDA